MHVRVAAVAAKAEDVETFRRHGLADGAADSPNDRLEAQVLLVGEVIDDRRPVRNWRDEAVPEKRRVQVEEADGEVVPVHHVWWGVGRAGNDLANETWSFTGPADVRLDIRLGRLYPLHVDIVSPAVTATSRWFVGAVPKLTIGIDDHVARGRPEDDSRHRPSGRR
jgi:hypothetical protein